MLTNGLRLMKSTMICDGLLLSLGFGFGAANTVSTPSLRQRAFMFNPVASQSYRHRLFSEQFRQIKFEYKSSLEVVRPCCCNPAVVYYTNPEVLANAPSSCGSMLLTQSSSFI